MTAAGPTGGLIDPPALRPEGSERLRAIVSPVPLQPKQQRSRETRVRLLNAAVDELVERGYAAFTGGGVAQRAGISRGAQQNHFPSRTTLLGETVRHMGSLQKLELERAVDRVGEGPSRLRVALDLIYTQYGSSRFATMIELSMAARTEPELQEIVAVEERAIAAELTELASKIFGAERAAGISKRWATALAAIRGLALLKLLGHAEAAVDRQWRSTRSDLLRMLADPEE